MEFEQSLREASKGNRAATADFLGLFLQYQVYVPERYQSQPLSNSPSYPNDFINILGIAEPERVVIPVFTDAEGIELWSGQELKYKTLSGQELLALVPPDWWLTLNPGSDYGKDFSPWEIQLLDQGKESIPTIIDEMFESVPLEDLQLTPLEGDEYQELERELVKTFSGRKEIQMIHILEGVEDAIGESDLPRVVIGIRISSQDPAESRALRQEVQTTAERALIGAASVRTFVFSDSVSDPLSSAFRQLPAVWQRKAGFRFKLPNLLKLCTK